MQFVMTFFNGKFQPFSKLKTFFLMKKTSFFNGKYEEKHNSGYTYSLAVSPAHAPATIQRQWIQYSLFLAYQLSAFPCTVSGFQLFKSHT